MNASLGEIIRDWLIDLGISKMYAVYLKNAIIFISILILSVLTYYITKKIIIQTKIPINTGAQVWTSLSIVFPFK